MFKDKKLYVVLYEPRMASNVGAIVRTCSCFEISIIVIEPVGFQWRDPDFKRAKLDYNTDITIIPSFSEFLEKFKDHRKILLTPHTNLTTKEFQFLEQDVLCFGRETNGVELENMQYFEQLLRIEMAENCRSFNLASSVAMTISSLNFQ